MKIAKLKIENSCVGFTLLEITIVIAIIAGIGSAGIASFVRSRSVRNLTTAGHEALSVLRVAQERSLAGKDTSVWGVHLTQNSFTLFRGIDFSASTSTEAYALPLGIEIVNIVLAGGGSDVLFKRVTGETNQSGSFDIRIANAMSNVFSVTIDTSGKVYQSGTPPSVLGTRIVDARHRLFNLGWSIQPAVTMTLTFSDPPNPDTIHPVVMAPFFDGMKSKFDWSGTVAVGASNQTLRIHTTLLTSGATILSVDRDCRANTKKLVISIDTKVMATYEANCSTITVGPWGGTMTEP